MKILIVNRYYTVGVAEPTACELADVKGWCDYSKRKIFVDSTLDESATREVLWHEIIHALWNEHAFPDRRSEEQVVTWLSKAITAFIECNGPFVRKYLL